MTNEDFQNLIIDYINSLQLPSALGVLSGGLRRLESAEASHMSQMAMSAATACQSDTNRLIKLLRATVNYFNQIDTDITEISGGGIIRAGVTVVSLPGSNPENVVETVTGLSWVTANTIAFPFPPSSVTSAAEVYAVKAGNYVVGDGFDITVYNPSNNTASDVTVPWIALPDGYTD